MLAIIQTQSPDTFWTPLNVIITLMGIVIIPLVVYLIQQISRNAQMFNNCAKSLQADNPIEQLTAAILLRSFLDWKWWKALYQPNYTKEAKNLMVVLLREPSIPTNLQKTIADGFSYASDMDGQDFQTVNMLDALIKPESRIQYELTGIDAYKADRISMCNADFYHAVLQECNINSINATGAKFFSAILCGTSFKNCILKDANFQNSNIRKVRFDEDCVLEGACFKGSVGIDTASITMATDHSTHPLIEYLDKDGLFHSEGVAEDNRYTPNNKVLKIFVSKLGSMDSEQRKHYNSAIAALQKLQTFEINKIDRKDYPNVSQLTDVKTHLEHCDGCIIFAFEYLVIESGHIHKNIVGDDHKEITETIAYPSPWLHIEAALANGMQMPCLIIYADNICRDGMFDKDIVEPDKNLFAMPYSDTLSQDDIKILNDWFGLVREFHSKNHS